MALIRVTASDIRSKKEQLLELNNQFKTQVRELESSEGTLNSQWDGAANDAFHKAFMNDKNYMDQFYNLILKYCDALEQIAAKYEQAEAANENTATTRTAR